MTLNITIVSPLSIHQSADFRLSRLGTGGDETYVELQSSSSKIITLIYEKWSGLLTYCGIGMWNGKRTDEYATEWLADNLDTRATFTDVAETLREEGTAWITSINSSTTTVNAHSFILAGFEEGTPIYASISNYQTLTRNIMPASKDLKTDIRRSTTGIHVFVNGLRGSVSDAAKRKLKYLVRTGTDANVIRHELGNANRIAAQSPLAKNGISPACLTYSFDLHRGGAGEIHGDVPGPVMPRVMLGGVDTSKSHSKIFHPNANTKLVQSAFATSESNAAEIKERIDCEFHVMQERSSGDTQAAITVEEVGAINDYCLLLHGLNNDVCMVGQLRKPVHAAPQAFAWLPGQEFQNLGTFGGPTSNALSINENGAVVGAAHLANGATHAFVWNKSEGMLDLGTLGGRDSVARWINNSGQVAGNSFVGAGDPHPALERAFLWTPNGGMVNLCAGLEGWSRAVAINNHGTVIGWRQRGMIVCGFVWSPVFGFVDIVGEGNRAFFPSAISDSGLVAGEGDDSSGRRRAFVWSREEGIRRLGVADEFHPSCIDADGRIIGYVSSRPWSRPYLYDIATAEFLALPFIENHHTTPKAINETGVIVGAAWKASWKHTHPLIWRLPAIRATNVTESGHS